MRVLITGGFGFVGGRLAQHLQQIGHHVVLGSRSVRSAPDRGLPEASVAVVDWANIEALKKICDGVDVVIQAAGMNARACEAHPLRALEVNGLNTARLLEAAIAVDVGRFVYLSTAHVYASPLAGSISENTCPRNLHPYATSHLAGENPVLRAGLEGSIQGLVVRLSNAFGAPVHQDVDCWGLLVNDLCKQSVETGQINLRSSGSLQRDFIAMAEVCRTLERLCSPSIRLPQPGIVNLGSGVSHSVLEMAQLVQLRCKQVLGFEPELRRPSDIDEPHEGLDYGTDRLIDMGIQVTADNDSEIESLLTFCHATFKKTAEPIAMIEATQPLVSVVIPTYNHAHFLGRALQSVLDQTFPDWEAIVIDNHSGDNTDQVIQSFNDARITTLKIHNNGIIAASRNAGIRAAKGDWIAFLDSDDLWYPQKLATALKGIAEDMTVDVCSTDEVLVNELTGDRSVLEYGPCSSSLYKELLVEGNRFSPSAALVRRDFLSRMGIGFRENKEFVTAEDYDLWMLLARAGAKFKCVHSVQGEYRIHANNSSGQIAKHSQNAGNVIRDHVYRLQTFETDRDRLWRSINARLLVTRSKNLILERQFIAGFLALVNACRSSSSSTVGYVFHRLLKLTRRSR